MSFLATLTGLAVKYGPIAGKVWGAIQNWATRRRVKRLETLMEYVAQNGAKFPLPAGFDEQEEFEDFAYAVFDAATRTSSDDKVKLLSYVLINEAMHGSEVAYPVKTKVQELLPLVQVHHVELLKLFHRYTLTPDPHVSITDLEGSLHTLRNATPADQFDLFYSAVSDLVRWYLIRSTHGVAGVNIARAGDYIPGSGAMGFMRITHLGAQFLSYLRDPNGTFIDVSALVSDDGASSGAPEAPAASA